MRKLYTNYLRDEVKKLLPWGTLLFGICALVTLCWGINKKAFNQIDEKLTEASLQFIVLFATSLLGTIIYLLSRKYPAALDFIPPLLVVIVFLVCIPTYYESPKEAVVIAGPVLTQISVAMFFFQTLQAQFCTTNYLVALICRIFVYAIQIHLLIRRSLTIDVGLSSLIGNEVVFVVCLEFQTYNMMKKEIKLFLLAETSITKEQTTSRIMDN